MAYQFPADVDRQVKAILASGDFADEDEVLRKAVEALARQRQEVAAIVEGYEDVKAGRVRSLEDVDAEIRKEFGFSGSTDALPDSNH